MKIVVTSAFRNATRYLERYFEQMGELKSALAERDDRLSLVLGYGDSSDGTGGSLYDECHHRFDTKLIEVNHGGPHFGSIVHEQRFKQLAKVWNRIWREIPEDADYVAFIESDLIWRAQKFIDLFEFIQGLRSIRSDTNAPTLVAPLVLHLDERFYDTWAFRYNGVQFKNDPPYHKGLEGLGSYTEMNSVGSFILMDGNIARKLSFPEEDVIVGLCRQARLLGARIFLDKLTKVYHP